jgi:hypothetical protein
MGTLSRILSWYHIQKIFAQYLGPRDISALLRAARLSLDPEIRKWCMDICRDLPEAESWMRETSAKGYNVTLAGKDVGKWHEIVKDRTLSDGEVPRIQYKAKLTFMVLVLHNSRAIDTNLVDVAAYPDDSLSPNQPLFFPMLAQRLDLSNGITLIFPTVYSAANNTFRVDMLQLGRDNTRVGVDDPYLMPHRLFPRTESCHPCLIDTSGDKESGYMYALQPNISPELIKMRSGKRGEAPTGQEQSIGEVVIRVTYFQICHPELMQLDHYYFVLSG